MSVVLGFINGSNVLRSTNQDIERTINLYVEATAPGDGKTPGALLATPGLRAFGRVNTTEAGSCSFYQDGRAFIIAGTTFAELFSDGTVTVRGFVTEATTPLPSTIVSNGTAGGQLLIVSGGDGFVYTLATNVLVQITNTNFPGTGFPDGSALACEFLDGYGIVLWADSREFGISALEDFTLWDPLDVAQRSEGSDNLVGVIRNHRELWFPGTLTGEVWYDSGDALFPFAPVPGVFLEVGAATFSMCRVNAGSAQTIAWISLDARGRAQVMIADGYSPHRISTTAVERNLQSSTNLNTAKLFCQQQEGHTFLWILVADLQTTWVYDFLTGIWHERALWNTTTCQWEPHPAITSIFAFNTSLVTSRLNGEVYALDLTAYNDELVA